MKILVVGGGGREHALAWKLAHSPKVEQIFITPGNAGTALVGENIGLAAEEEILSWLKDNPVELVVIGPDNYLAEGLSDRIQRLGIPVFGSTQGAARIEWSKSFAKEFMREAGIPTARSETFTDYESARTYIAKETFPVVIKADGLALGKGVVIAENIHEAEGALEDMLRDHTLGKAGGTVVIEEFLVGREISIHAFCDGEHVALFPASQDHKRRFEEDRGPNTGGMGTVVPVPWVTDDMMHLIREQVVLPCIQALKKKGSPFIGVIYPGIMMTAEGPKVIEFNARFGDPETQSYMRILKSDLVDICLACTEGKLDQLRIEWESAFASCVTLVSEGYPRTYEKGRVIDGLDEVQDSSVEIFHAGTARRGARIVTNGGRVLNVTAKGSTLQEAVMRAYAAVECITFEGMQFRTDIGTKALRE